MEKKDYTPILPFDITIGENFVTYDNQTYHQDLDYITADKIKKESGNIIKYYRCSTAEPYPIGSAKEEEPLPEPKKGS